MASECQIHNGFPTILFSYGHFTSAWYYHTNLIVSCLREIINHSNVILHFRHILDKKRLSARCDLFRTLRLYVYTFKNSVSINFWSNKKSCFFKFGIYEIYNVSCLHDTIMEMWYFAWLHDYIVSHRRDTIISLW